MDTIITIFSFVFGAVIGSFLNVVIYRLPLGQESVVYPPSHCPHCQKPIAWYDNIPLLSYLALAGKCRHCKAPIPCHYPLVELCMGLLSAALFHKFGLGFEFLRLFIFSAGLLAIIFIDFKHQIIPDVISIGGILLGFAGSFVSSHITWQQSGLGILIGGGILYGIALGYMLLTGREGMGGGDIKLLAMIGAFLGWQSLLFVLFFSSLTGCVAGIGAMVKQKKGGQSRIPYGPFLSLAALVYLFFEQDIFHLWKLYLMM